LRFGEGVAIADGAIGSKKVTCDFARLMDGATEIQCSEFGSNRIDHM
jgi:isocitrate dehydrogenase